MADEKMEEMHSINPPPPDLSSDILLLLQNRETTHIYDRICLLLIWPKECPVTASIVNY